MLPLPAKVQQAAGKYETQEINTCLVVSDERQSASLTRVAALFIRGQLCAMPMNILLQDGLCFPFQKL